MKTLVALKLFYIDKSTQNFHLLVDTMGGSQNEIFVDQGSNAALGFVSENAVYKTDGRIF
jgi:hypothetical protein